MNAIQLSPSNAAEQKVQDAAADGSWAEFPQHKQSSHVVRAEFLRYLLLFHSPCSGIHISRAHIQGKLDLADAVKAGGVSLPPLELEDCEIPDEIDLSYARIQRFSIAQCRIAHLRARGAHIEGPFDFSGVTAYAASKGKGGAWIDARGAHIGGDVEGRKADLQAPARRALEDIPVGENRYALNLRNCSIHGRMMLVESFRAVGGVNIADSDVYGEVWLRGADLTSGEGNAFEGQSARFRSALGLDMGFHARGTVGLLGAKIEGSLACTDARFENQTVTDGKKDGKGIALTAESASIGGDVFLRGEKFNASGIVSLQGAKIDGGLDCSEATFDNQTDDGKGYALYASQLTVRGHVRLEKTKFKGTVDVGFSRISGSFHCSQTRFENVFHYSAGIYALVGTNAEIEGDLYLSGATCIGEVSLWGTHIGRNFYAENSTFICSGTAIAAPHLFVAGDLSLYGSNILGTIWMPHINIDGALNWSEIQKHSFDADKSCKFHEKYELENTAYLKPSGWPNEVNLENARIGAVLRTKKLISEGKIRINLRGARAGRLDDLWPEGWVGDPSKVTLDLDGFIYDRIDHLPPAPPKWIRVILNWVRSFLNALGKLIERIGKGVPGPQPILTIPKSLKPFFRERPSADDRLDWLQLQDATEFSPQPYRCLASVLRTQGHLEAAREVGIRENWQILGETPGIRAWHHILKSFFGFFFGFGLAPVRSFFFCLAFALLGWFGTSMAIRKGAMVITTTPVASVLVRDSSSNSNQPAMPQGEPLNSVVEEACSDQIVPPFYAVDVMLPVIPLHQETVCDITTSHRPWMWAWRLGKFTYSVFGKLFATLALITSSGVLRVREEDD